MKEEAMMEQIWLRPHHALCAQFFAGKGYSRAFVENMRAMLTALGGGDTEVALTDGCDAICAACPNNNGGLCVTDEKVRGIDERAAEAMGLRIGDTLPWRELCERARREIIRPGALRDVCRNCEWIGICAGRDAER